MKKLLGIVLCLALVLCTAGMASADILADIQAKGTLLVGAEVNFPPYEFHFTNPETGEEELKGFEMEMAKGIADALGVELVVADQTFAGLITALRAGEIDMIISGLSIKPERQEVVDFSNPYYDGKQIMLVRKDDLEKYATVEGFDGANIGAQTGSLQAGIAEEQFSKSNITLLDKVPVLVLELRSGNIDGLPLTDNVALTYVTLFPDELAIAETPIHYESPGIALAVNKGENESLLAAVNGYIDTIKADGTFDKWLDEAIALNAQLVAAQAE